MNRKILALLISFSLIAPSFGEMSFDGADDYVSIGLNKLGPKANGASFVTVSAWVKHTVLDVGKYDNVVIQVRDITGASIWINICGDGANAGKVLAGGRSVSTDSFQEKVSTQILSSGRYYHVVAIFDYAGDTINIAIDGILVGTTGVTFGSSTYVHSVSATIVDSISAVATVTYAFGGRIDDVRLYNRALSVAEIGSLALSRSRLKITDGLVGYWPMDEGNSGANGSGAIVLDRSGSGNNGTGIGTNGPIFQASGNINYP